MLTGLSWVICFVFVRLIIGPSEFDDFFFSPGGIFYFMLFGDTPYKAVNRPELLRVIDHVRACWYFFFLTCCL
jgi:hypothetical protein